MFIKTFFTVPALVISIGIALAKPADEKGSPSIVGEWVISEFFFEGVEQPREAREERSFVITEKEFHQIDRPSFVERKNQRTFQLKLDDTKSPKELDIFEKGENISRGIYKFDKGRLVLVLKNRDRQKRPESFTPAKDDGNFIYTLTRKK